MLKPILVKTLQQFNLFAITIFLYPLVLRLIDMDTYIRFTIYMGRTKIQHKRKNTDYTQHKDTTQIKRNLTDKMKIKS